MSTALFKMETKFSLLILAAFLCLWVVEVEGGECCLAFYDVTLSETKEKWCDNYCCVQLTRFDCCDQKILRAPAERRADFCSAWFTDHVWAPVLISLGILGVIVGAITCCCCCCCACCRNSNRPGTVMMQPATPNVLVVTSGGGAPAAAASPYSVGYDQQTDHQYK